MPKTRFLPKYEDETNEFKIQWSDTAKKTLCAFLNTRGGTIWFGIDNRGSAVGVENHDSIANSVANTLIGVRPNADRFVSIEFVPVDNRTVVAIHVAAGIETPYKIMVKGEGSKVYIRRGPATFEATEEELRQLYQKGDPVPWEAHVSRRQDLTFFQTKQVFDRLHVEFSERVYPILKLVNEFDGRFNNAAFLLSDQCTAETRLGFFKGGSKGSESLGFRTFTGSVLAQYEAVEEALRQRLDFTFDIGPVGSRIEHHPFPPRAIREALLNLFVHRDYSIRTQATVTCFDDRLEFLAIGGLPPRCSFAKLRKGISICRNEILCGVFAKLDFIELYGIGIPRIYESYEGEHVQPVLECDDDMVCITLPKIANPTAESRLTDRQKDILAYIRSRKTVRRADVQNAFALVYGSTIKELGVLMENKMIIRTGSGPSTLYKAL